MFAINDVSRVWYIATASLLAAHAAAAPGNALGVPMRLATTSARSGTVLAKRLHF